MSESLAVDRKVGRARHVVFILGFGMLALAAGPSVATSIVPISDPDLAARADAIVHGVVVSNQVASDALGRPETVTSIAPLEVLKGRVPAVLVLHQLGGTLPDGRFFKLWGRPEYQAGSEVIVFAIARPEGDYQTAELLLGKFAVQQDERGSSFAVPALIADDPVQVTITRHRVNSVAGNPKGARVDDVLAPRDLGGFLLSLRSPQGNAPSVWLPPHGVLTPVVHPEYQGHAVAPKWVNIGSNWRWDNGAAAVFTPDGQANVTGGGITEATGAALAWSAEPNSTINYSIGTGSANPIHLNALSSPCGWSTCMSTGGVIGCGGPMGGGGTNVWRGETYETINNGEVWLRAYCTLNLFDTVTTQSVLTHELGHTLGLGHSDQGISPHDGCSGDESLATMRSNVQHRTTLGTDDADAVRWLYGDGGNSCSSSGGPMLTVTKSGGGAGTVSGAPAGISCGTTCSSTSSSFASGTVVTLSAVAAANSVFAGWGGDADCADGKVTMSAARNCTASFTLLPDLAISSLTVPPSATAGSIISVSETTMNQGGSAAVSTTRYYLSTSTTYDVSATALGFRTLTALAPGSTSSARVQLTIPSGLAAGSYYILARADADGQVAESNETNNTAAGAMSIGAPDLVISAISRVATSGAGLTITVSDTTRNQSATAPAAPSVTRFYLSADTTIAPGDVAIGSRSVPALQPGASSAGSTSLLIPPGTNSGTYYIIAKANDAPAPLAESNVTNNTRSSSIVIGPDMTVSSLSVPATGGAGLPITVTDTTKNQGAGSTAQVTTTSFYLSANTTVGAGDVLLGSRSVGNLGPNGTDSVSTTLTIPPGTVPGSYYIVAVADDGNAVSETSETNNTRAAVIKLSPDLIVSALTVPATAPAGATIDVGDTTRNQGSGSAIATTTQYYLSLNTAFDAAADVLLGNRDVPVLLTGVSNVGPLTPLAIPPGTAAGKYYILAVADAGHAVLESNETNNTASKPITITAP